MKLFQKMLVASTALGLISPLAAQASDTMNLEEMNNYSRSSSKVQRFDNKTFSEEIGMIGFNKIDIFLICSTIVFKIVFILSLSFFFKAQGSESLKYLFASKEKSTTILIYSFKF